MAMSDYTCKVEGCKSAAHSKMLCSMHYYRFKTHGSPTLGGAYKPKKGELLRFIRDAVSSETDQCISWPFNKTNGGYAIMNAHNQNRFVSRTVLESTGRPRPSLDHFAAHAPIVCNNPKCINPRHLRWATRVENMADKKLDGTQTGLVGEANPHAKLTSRLAGEIRSEVGTCINVGRKYGVSAATVSYIRSGKRWVPRVVNG